MLLVNIIYLPYSPLIEDLQYLPHLAYQRWLKPYFIFANVRFEPILDMKSMWALHERMGTITIYYTTILNALSHPYEPYQPC